MKVFGVIMAGGGGTRFWPLSRKKMPKQFLNLTGKDILVNEAFDRLCGVAAPEDIFVVTHKDYVETTKKLMAGRIRKDRILAEPEARNTAACIGYAAMAVLKKEGDGVLCILPSDHYIREDSAFQEALQKGVGLAEDGAHLITIGITPTYPATGYGYIRSAGEAADGVYAVEEFVEKPIEEAAEAYLKDGRYFWNSGIFIWRASLILEYFQKLLPDVYACLQEIGEAMGTADEQTVLNRIYPHIPKISIDYGIMERALGVWMLPGRFGWNDVGSLDALEVLHKKDGAGNVGIGNHVLFNTEGTICYAKDKMIAAIGVKNLMIVEAEDTVLICPKDSAQEVKKLVEELEKQGRTEYL